MTVCLEKNYYQINNRFSCFTFQINAHPVLEGSSGYAHVSISGEPHSILSLTANGADQRERLNAAPEILHTFEDRNLVNIFKNFDLEFLKFFDLNVVMLKSSFYMA